MPRAAQERKMENQITTDSVVLSLIQNNQTISGATEYSGINDPPISESIMLHVSGIHWLFEDVMRIGDPMQRAHSDVADLVLKIRV